MAATSRTQTCGLSWSTVEPAQSLTSSDCATRRWVLTENYSCRVCVSVQWFTDDPVYIYVTYFTQQVVCNICYTLVNINSVAVWKPLTLMRHFFLIAMMVIKPHCRDDYPGFNMALKKLFGSSAHKQLIGWTHWITWKDNLASSRRKKYPDGLYLRLYSHNYWFLIKRIQ